MTRYSTVKDIFEKTEGTITESAARWLLLHRKKNGFSQCVRKVGRKILINLDELEKWIESKKV